jgi:hypothetical protein
MWFPITTILNESDCSFLLIWRTRTPYYRLEKTGIEPGWRCLEIGAGLGTVSLWLADKVGEGGEVVCTDLQPKFISEINDSRITVEKLDILKAPKRHGVFDLAIVRNVHHHIPDRDAAVHNLVKMVRPGGHILYVEPDLHPALEDFHPVWRRTWQAYRQWAEQHDINVFTGRRLPLQLARLGLEIVSSSGETALFNGSDGDNPARHLYRSSLDVIMPELTATGLLTEAEGKETYRLLDSDEAWLMNFCFFAVHVRKPSWPWSIKCVAVSAIRRVLHEGQTPRPLQKKATRKSCLHWPQRARAKP